MSNVKKAYDARPRNLTEADVEAIVDALGAHIKKEFYQDLGRGVWSVIWRVIVAWLIGIAAIGAYKHGVGG